jgi:hypothetical protein
MVFLFRSILQFAADGRNVHHFFNNNGLHSLEVPFRPQDPDADIECDGIFFACKAL